MAKLLVLKGWQWTNGVQIDQIAQIEGHYSFCTCTVNFGGRSFLRRSRQFYFPVLSLFYLLKYKQCLFLIFTGLQSNIETMRILTPEVFENLDRVPNCSKTLTTPFHRAIAEGNLDKVKKILNDGTDINYRNFLGVTPLQLALLFQIRAHHYFPRQISIEQITSMSKIIDFLLEQGADIHATDFLGRTPIFYALSKNTPIVVLSAERWRFPLQVDVEQWSKKFFSDCGQTIALSLNDKCQVIELGEWAGLEDVLRRLHQQFGTYARNEMPGCKPLIDAFTNDFSIVYEFIEQGADITIKDYEGRTIFYHLFHRDNAEESTKTFLKIFVRREDTFEAKFLSHVREKMFLNDIYTKFYYDCKRELEELKQRKASRWLSFNDILTKPIERISACIKYQNLVKLLQSDAFDNFPAYGDWLKFRAEKIRERQLLYDKCMYVFNRCFTNERSLPFLIYDEILSYLPMKDMKRFSEITP